MFFSTVLCLKTRTLYPMASAFVNQKSYFCSLKSQYHIFLAFIEQLYCLMVNIVVIT